MSFARSLRLALLCAAACGLWIALAQPLLGRPLAVRSGLVVSAAAWLIGLAPQRSGGTLAAALLAGASAALLLLGVGTTLFASALAVAIGVLRSTWLWPVPRADAATFARRFLGEVALVGGGLAFAAGLWRHATSLPEALAVWGFLLVQSAFFALEGGAPRPAGAGRTCVDPFEDRCRRLRAVLEQRS